MEVWRDQIQLDKKGHLSKRNSTDNPRTWLKIHTSLFLSFQPVMPIRNQPQISSSYLEKEGLLFVEY